MSRRQHVAVIGGGIQGICTALELQGRGHHVSLIERDGVLFNRASLRSEGKIHLGLIYAADESRDTARRMASDALEFAVILNRLTDNAFRTVPVSTPFLYLVPPDSMLTPNALEEHYTDVAAILAERMKFDAGLHYLGERLTYVWRKLPPGAFAEHGIPTHFIAAYDTQELAIDLRALSELLRQVVVQAERIDVRLGNVVRSIGRRADGRFVVEGDSGSGSWRIEVDQVVNATWDQRLALDATMGIAPPGPWVHRLKYRVLARLPASLRGRRSVTYTLGPYGDIVVYPDGTAYVSWYPVCRQGWSRELAPPAEWEKPCQGDVTPEMAASVAQPSLVVLDHWFPGIGCSEVLAVDAGAITAWGGTEINDPNSGLHLRSQTGVHSTDGYHSIDTGKFTNAPHYAMRAADAVEGR
jgi:glycine/D-amino acid oxidase-like deaminating enzyme